MHTLAPAPPKADVIDAAAQDASKKLASLRDYVAVLTQASLRDTDDHNTQSSDKFQALEGLIDGHPAPNCPICLVGCCEEPIVYDFAS